MSADKIYITCRECGRVLDVLTEVIGDIEIAPCKHCLNNATAEAYANGYNDGGESDVNQTRTCSKVI